MLTSMEKPVGGGSDIDDDGLGRHGHEDNDDNNDDNITMEEATRIWNNLVDWVQRHQPHGGFVHPSLILRTTSSSSTLRGIYTQKPIVQGELLIRIPASACLSSKSRGKDRTLSLFNTGNRIGGIQDLGASTEPPPATPPPPPPSPWLQCVAAYLREVQISRSNSASSSSASSASPYLASLPQRYETLLVWTDDEIQSFLKGTTLGNMALDDRRNHVMKEQYQQRVEPFLRHVGILSNVQDECGTATDDNDDDPSSFEDFLQASCCISTRGFHMSSSSPTTTTTTTTATSTAQSLSSSVSSSSSSSLPCYDGPFLIPVIDLLNHDPTKTCTTLRRDTDGNFIMVAERALMAHEEVVHSYGINLSSAQLLQTFGFVPVHHTTRIMAQALAPRIQTASLEKDHSSLTPVSLNRNKHLLPACRFIKQSSVLIEAIQDGIRRSTSLSDSVENDDDDNDSIWDVRDIPDRTMNDTMPNEFLVSSSSSSSVSVNLLSEELLTFLIAQFLPKEAYHDIFEANGDGEEEDAVPLLDRSILIEDPYLCLLVTKTVQETIDRRLSMYARCEVDEAVTQTLDGFYADKIERLMKEEQRRLRESIEKPCKSIGEVREMYGRTIRCEEMYHLHLLHEEVKRLWNASAEQIWGVDDALTWRTTDSPVAKRIKTSQEIP